MNPFIKQTQIIIIALQKCDNVVEIVWEWAGSLCYLRGGVQKRCVELTLKWYEGVRWGYWEEYSKYRD